MLEIKYAVPGRTARYGCRSSELCQMMSPLRSSMRVIRVCGAMMPLFANAPYADVRSSERHLAGAERQRRHRGQWRADTQPARVGLRRRDADELHYSGCGAIARDRQRLAQRVAGGFVLARRKPVALRGMNRRVHAGHLRAGHISLLERGREEERFERGARLPLRLHRAIERARVKVAAAHHREHLAGARVDRHERRLKIIGFVELREPRGDRVFGVPLQRHVDRGVDAKAALQHILRAELLHHLAPHGFEKMESRCVSAVRDVRAMMRGRVGIVALGHERQGRRNCPAYSRLR